MEAAALKLELYPIMLDISIAEGHEILHSLRHSFSKQIQDDIPWGSFSDIDWESNLMGYLFLNMSALTVSKLQTANPKIVTSMSALYI